MTYLIKKLFTLILVPLFIACTPAKAAWHNWRDYFPSSLSVKRDNLKEWTIPVLGATALVTAGYFGYKYMVGRKKASAANTAPEGQQKPEQDASRLAHDEPAAAPAVEASESVEKDPYEVKDEKPDAPLSFTVKKLENVLIQTDTASCGLHCLRNAPLLLGNDVLEEHSVPLLTDENDFQDKKPIFIDCIEPLRKKKALKSYLTRHLESFLKADAPAKIKHGVANYAGGITELALGQKLPKKFVSTRIIGELERKLNLKDIDKSFENLDDIIIDDNLVATAIIEESRRSLMEEYRAIQISFDEQALLMLAVNSPLYETFVQDLQRSKTNPDSDLNNALKRINYLMGNDGFAIRADLRRDRDNAQPIMPRHEIDLLLGTPSDNLFDKLLELKTTKQREWMQTKLQNDYGLNFPNNVALLNEFFENPDMLAKLQTMWLMDNEIEAFLASNGGEIKDNTTVISSQEDILLFQGRNDKKFKYLRQKFHAKGNYKHIFIVNTASEAKPKDSGHWFIVVAHKVDRHVTLTVVNSLNHSIEHKPYPLILEQLQMILA